MPKTVNHAIPAEGLLPSSYARLPSNFYARLAPTPVARPRLIQFNPALADELGLGADDLDAGALAAMFSGNLLPPGVEPIAMAYAGHQFGQFVPQLGDGRAILLGEARDRSRHASRHSAQGLGTHAVFAQRRWPRSDWARAARVSGQRGHARAW